MTATPEPEVDLTRALPVPFGYSAAIENVGAAAAPLLAGFAFALIGLVIQDESSLRWPNLTLTVLVAAAILLIGSVQCAFTARQYYVPPDEWLAWLELAQDDSRKQYLQRQQLALLSRYRVWLANVRYTYNLGIATLFLAVAASLVPPTADGPVPAGRLAAIALALGGLGVELSWMAVQELGAWRRRRENRRIAAQLALLPPETDAVS